MRGWIGSLIVLGVVMFMIVPVQSRAASAPVSLSYFRLPANVTGPSHFFASDGGGPQVPPADSFTSPQTLAELGTYEYGVTPNVPGITPNAPTASNDVQAYYEAVIYKTVDAARAANAENRDGAVDGSGRPLAPLSIARLLNDNEWLRASHTANSPGHLFCLVTGGVRYQNVRLYAFIQNSASAAFSGALPCTQEGRWTTRVMRALYPKAIAYVAAHPPLAVLNSPTSIHIVEPFDAHGHLLPGYNPDASPQMGMTMCSSDSYVSRRADAYRCVEGNQILDPCFVPTSGHATIVACVQDPRIRYATVLRLTSPLPAHDGTRLKAGQGQPWAFDLATAEQCGVVGGATLAVGTLRLNYGCSPGASVYGDVARTGRQWTALVWRGSPSTTPTRSQLVRVGILIAYF